MRLNQAVLAEVIEWGQTLPGFKRFHATNALTFVQGYVDGVEDERGQRIPGIGQGDQERFCLYVMDMAWVIWLDELFDASTEPGSAALDVEAIVSAFDGPPTTTASEGFPHLRARFEPYLTNGAERRLWLETAASTIKAWGMEERLSREGVQMSYSEYLENGINSGVVPHLLATASVLYAFDMPARLGDPAVRQLVRHLSIQCRLHNDLFSVEKERAEGTMANAVLLMDRFMAPEASRRFVADELRAYEQMLKTDICSLGETDPFSRMARVMPESHRILYVDPQGSYRMAATNPPR